MNSVGTSDFLSGLKAMSRPGLLVGAVLAVLVSGLPTVRAEETGKTFKVALLSPSAPVPRFSQLHVKTFRDLGYVEGRNLIFMERWAGGSEERLRRDAAELVELKVDLILAGTSTGVRAAVAATKTIPIVAVDLESDPVANGWVASLARPGGNVTGFFLDMPDFSGKRLEQLKEVVPGLSRVAVLWDTIMDRTPLKATEVSARALGLRMLTLEVRGPEDFERAFRRAVKQRAQAVLMWGSPMFDGNASKIAALAAQHRLPIAGFFPFHPESGFLMSYGPDVDDLIRRCWVYADRILKGEKPGNLPVQRPAKFHLVLNLKTAKTLGITFPQTILLQADHVIK
ncbi:MAG: ABC transporter substrate-binding protein [Burkholderiales bacterium]